MFPFIEAQHEALLYWIFNSLPPLFSSPTTATSLYILIGRQGTGAEAGAGAAEGKLSSNYENVSDFLLLSLKYAAFKGLPRRWGGAGGVAVSIVKWEWDWMVNGVRGSKWKAEQGVVGVASYAGNNARKKRNKCCILCSAPGSRQSQCEM